MARLPDLLGSLPPDAQKVYDRITAKRGKIGGPYVPLMHHPVLAERLRPGRVPALRGHAPRRPARARHPDHRAPRGPALRVDHARAGGAQGGPARRDHRADPGTRRPLDASGALRARRPCRPARAGARIGAPGAPGRDGAGGRRHRRRRAGRPRRLLPDHRGRPLRLRRPATGGTPAPF